MVENMNSALKIHGPEIALLALRLILGGKAFAPGAIRALAEYCAARIRPRPNIVGRKRKRG